MWALFEQLHLFILGIEDTSTLQERLKTERRKTFYPIYQAYESEKTQQL